MDELSTDLEMQCSVAYAGMNNEELALAITSAYERAGDVNETQKINMRQLERLLDVQFQRASLLTTA